MAFFLLRSNLVGQPTCINNFLSPEECQSIVSSGENDLDLLVAKTEDHQVHQDLRRSEISWFDPGGAHEWLFSRIRDCIVEINTHLFGYNLVGFEGIQFTKYSRKGEHPDFYSSHQDTALLPGGTIRKLSFTIQLSDPQTYDGGEVVLYKSLTDSVNLTGAVGSISFFPSYTIHEVRPVTRGVRYSLVGWSCGPAFV